MMKRTKRRIPTKSRKPPVRLGFDECRATRLMERATSVEPVHMEILSLSVGWGGGKRKRRPSTVQEKAPPRVSERTSDKSIA